MKSHIRLLHWVSVLGVVLTLGACATPSPEQEASGTPFDPFESNNRKVHNFNKAVDRAVFGPASRGYTNLVPDPMEDSFNNFSKNLGYPGDAANYLAQGRLKESGIAAARFLINTTIGFAGLADPSTEFGLPESDTDFGETLYVWGVPEGGYVELPFFGPSTQRHAVGFFADFFTNPLSFTPQNPFTNIGVYAGALERLSDRGRYSDTIESVIYESEDSYAVAQVIFLENRRFELTGGAGDSFVDPYDDVYGGGSSDPYSDPYAETDLYEDPYAE